MIYDEYALYDSISGDQFREWLAHPVTKVAGLVIAAYIVRGLVLTHGARLLGLVDDAAGGV